MLIVCRESTVNLKIFARIFWRNGKITLPFTDVGKSCPLRKFLTSQMFFNAISESKILTKIS